MITRPNETALPAAPSVPPRSLFTTIAPHPAKTRAKVANPSATQLRASSLLFKELGDQVLHAPVDLVAAAPNGLEILAGRINERPVLVPLSLVDRARITAAHADHDVGGANDLICQGLR